MTITFQRYALVDREGHEGEADYETLNEAKAAAGTSHAIVEHRWEWADSELVWTPNGRGEWPPKGRRARP